jgi:hypothetical protein
MASNNVINTPLGTGVSAALGQSASGSGGMALQQSGLWTPVFNFATAGDLSVVYTSQGGNYVKIGNMLFFSCDLRCTPTFTTSSGLFFISGLPFSASSTNNNLGVGANIAWQGITLGGGYTQVGFGVAPGFSQTAIVLTQNGSALAINNIVALNFTTATAVVIQVTGMMITV